MSRLREQQGSAASGGAAWRARALCGLAAGILWLLAQPSPAEATMRTIEGFFMVPTPWGLPSGGTTFDVVPIFVNAGEYAYIFRAPKTGTITKVGFRTVTVITGATVDVRLETVSATDGHPTGSLVGTNANASQVIADTNDNVFFTVTLTAGASVTAGDVLAVVVVAPATGSLQEIGPGGFSFELAESVDFFVIDPLILFPYTDTYVPPIWTKGVLTPIGYIEACTGCVDTTDIFDGTVAGGDVVAALKDRTAGAFCPGTLTTTPSCENGRIRVPSACTIQRVDAVMITAPTGAALNIDVLECDSNGATCATTGGNPNISAGANSGSDTGFTNAALDAGDTIQVDVTQVGSTVAGSDLTVTVTCQF
jgi:hypothetical protein